jgi:soluble lytic murein transglycosylase-like protein
MILRLRRVARFGAGLLLIVAPMARAAEHVTLKNGFELDCVRREVDGDRVRLYLASGNENYMEVAANAVVRVEALPDLPVVAVAAPAAPVASVVMLPTAAEMKEMIARAGAAHHIDVDLLASVIHAESGGQVKAVSRTGARGLMQLMPGTAAALGISDSFVPEQNIQGGTLYLDQLLTRYKDNLALALAAYNAGPGAVDKYHGVPPYRETRAYVTRIIREFNRRKTAVAVVASR